MTLKTKGQALALVLIIVVLAIIVVLSVTSRVITDIRQQTLEKASSRAETLSTAAVDNITQQIQNGQIVINSGSNITIGIGTTQPTGSTIAPLSICNPTDPDLSKRCDNSSSAKVTAYNKIIRFTINNSENLEGHFFDKGVVGTKTGTDSEIIVSTGDNDSIDATRSSLLVKAFARQVVAGKTITKLVGECVWNIRNSLIASAGCIPTSTLTPVALPTCPDKNATNRYGAKCMKFRAVGSTGVSFYRVKAILKDNAGNPNPYVEISLLGSDSTNDYNFPVPQMAFIRAGVYTGDQENQQGIFQETNRLVLLNPAVPEAVDYVLYNGAGSPVVK